MADRNLVTYREPTNDRGYYSRVRIERLSSGQPGLIVIVDEYAFDETYHTSCVVVPDGNELLAPVVEWLNR